ncbi:MAG TPA: hypothetical protein VF504_05035, partial [Solirubrobacterales bacterium]
MNRRHFGRTAQMWSLVFACLGSFALFISFLPAVSFSLWWKIVLIAVLTAGGSVVVFQIWLNRVLVRRESAIQLIDRITAGDLSLTAK